MSWIYCVCFTFQLTVGIENIKKSNQSGELLLHLYIPDIPLIQLKLHSNPLTDTSYPVPQQQPMPNAAMAHIHSHMLTFKRTHHSFFPHLD